MENSKFVKAVAFTWIPLLFFITPLMAGVFRSISHNKATGLGAVAGGISEGLVTFGLVAIFVCEVYAMILFARIFPTSGFLTRFVAVVSIGCGVFYLLFLTASIVWLRFRAAG